MWADSLETDSLNDVKYSRIGFLEMRREKLLDPCQYMMPAMANWSFANLLLAILGQ